MKQILRHDLDQRPVACSQTECGDGFVGDSGGADLQTPAVDGRRRGGVFVRDVLIRRGKLAYLVVKQSDGLTREKADE